MLTYNVGSLVPASVKSLADFVAWCRANPGSANYATTAAGGTPHFVGVMLANAAHLTMTPVHYRGGAPALQDLIGGHVPASINPISETLTQAKSGNLRILAVTGARRSSFLPDVPTMKEAGADVDAVLWSGIFVPKATPPAIVKKLEGEFMRIARLPDVIARLKPLGIESIGNSSEDFAKILAADIARWTAVARAGNIKMEQ